MYQQSSYSQDSFRRLSLNNPFRVDSTSLSLSSSPGSSSNKFDDLNQNQHFQNYHHHDSLPVPSRPSMSTRTGSDSSVNYQYV